MSCTEYFPDDLPQNIPSWSDYAQSIIIVNDMEGLTVKNVKLHLTSITHSDPWAYLRVLLFYPPADKNAVNPTPGNWCFYNYDENTGANITNCILDNDATTSVNDVNAPCTGTYQPDDPFAVDGITANGEWFIRVYNDGSPGTTCTLNDWSLEICIGGGVFTFGCIF